MTVLALACLAVFALSLSRPVAALAFVSEALNDAAGLILVRRPEPWTATFESEEEDALELSESETPVKRILGLDRSQRQLYLVFPNLTDASIPSGDAFLDESLDSEESDDPNLPVSIARVNLENARVEWISHGENAVNIQPAIWHDRRIRDLNWMTRPMPDPQASGGFDVLGLVPDSTLWHYAPGRQRLLLGRRNEISRFLTDDRTRLLVQEPRRDYSRGSRILTRSSPSEEFLPPESWSGHLGARVSHIYADSSLALATIRFPKMLGGGYTQFVEVDLATGEMTNLLDQATVRTVDLGSIRLLSEEVFSVRTRDKTGLGDPYAVMSLYRTRPLRHFLEVPGLALYPLNGSPAVLALDSHNNQYLRQGKEIVMGSGKPVVRIVDLSTGAIESFNLAELLPAEADGITVEHLICSWRSNLMPSPASPVKRRLLVPAMDAHSPSFIVNLYTKSVASLIPGHPIGTFLWSPSGRYLALSSAELIGAGSPNVSAMPAAPSSPTESRPSESPSDGDEEPDHVLTIWDTETNRPLRRDVVEAIPIHWSDDETLTLLSPVAPYSASEPFEIAPLYRLSLNGEVLPVNAE